MKYKISLKNSGCPDITVDESEQYLPVTNIKVDLVGLKLEYGEGFISPVIDTKFRGFHFFSGFENISEYPSHITLMRVIIEIEGRNDIIFYVDRVYEKEILSNIYLEIEPVF